MKTKINFVFICLIFVSTSKAQITNIQVSTERTINPNEVSIAVNPINPLNISIGSNLDYFYSSHDGGKTWSEIHMTSAFGVWGDPVLVYDAEGNLFYGHLSNTASPGYWIDRIVVQKSTDNGITWDSGSGIGFSPPMKEQDKAWLAVDRTNSKYRNNVYMSWTEFDEYGSPLPSNKSRIRFARSTDNGKTWSSPQTISDVEGDCLDSDSTDEGAVPSVGPNGEIYVAWSGPKGIVMDKSADGGVTFGKDIFVASQPNGWDFGPNNVAGIYRCNGMPVTACDISNSPYRGSIYVMWGDQRNGLTNSDVFITKSVDGGNSWTKVLKVNDDNTSRHQFFPWMTVDKTTGYIYVLFYDRRNTEGAATDVYLARSTDGGYSFTNHKISESSFIPNKSVFFGDYTNIVAEDGKIYPVWMRLDTYSLSIWTAIINDKDLTTGIEQKAGIPENVFLYQNYPNPFNPNTTISYQIPKSSNVFIKVYDYLGREVASINEGFKQPGLYEINFNAKNLSSGIYIYKLETERYSISKKMILLK